MKCGTKRLLIASAFAFTASAPAFAADLPPPPAPPPRAPATYVPAPVPFYNWSGFYIGGNVGYGFGNGSNGLSDTAGSTFSSTTSQSFLGGGQVGVNWEFWGGVVIGAEADFDWLPNTSNTITATNGVSTATASINNRWLTLADARLGYAWDRFLLYAKGGGAFVGESNSSFTTGGVPFPLSGPSTNFGWNAGAGVEWAFWGTWSVRAEYDYIRLQSANFTASATAPPPFASDVITSNNRTIQLVTVGLNYKFGPW
jgi:outer membrane immunogenic protein